MLNEKQFRDRAVRELREIGKQVQSLTTDRDLFRTLENDVIAANPALAGSASPYLLLLRGAYTDATTLRLRRLLTPDANLSLRRIVGQVAEYPDLLLDKLTGKELKSDIAALETTAAVLQEKLDPHFSAHERTPAALEASNRQLDKALDLVVDCVKRYYWIIADAYIDVQPASEPEALSVFRSAWISAK